MTGFRCLGVQLASGEPTRLHPGVHLDESVATLTDGAYRTANGASIVRAGLAHLRTVRPAAIVIDSPADWIQLAIAVAARRLGAAVFTRFASTRTDWPRTVWRERLKGWFYRGWDGYLVTGELAREYLLSFGVPADRLVLCGNPSDSGAIEEAARAARAPDGADPARAASFLYVGRFLELKNLVRLVRGYARYRDQGGAWSLDLVGFGETESAIRRAARGVPDVRLHGALPFSEIVDLYLRSGALVLPSLSENWGLVVNEAMHAGLPLVLSDRCGCIPELVVTGARGNALLINPESEQEIEAALRHLSEMTAADREAMGQSSRERVAGQTPARWAAAVASGIEAALRGRPGRGPRGPGAER